MAEHMAVWLELWPVSIDEQGPWLISGSEPLHSTLPVMADSDPATEARLTLAEGDLDSALDQLIPGSWRVERGKLILGYLALCRSAKPVSELSVAM